jgi:hypothetical protein
VNLTLPEKYFLVDGPVVPGAFKRFERALTEAQAAGCPAAHLWIDSAWGEPREALRIHDFIVTLQMPVMTYCAKRAMSAGAIVFLAGTRRTAASSAAFTVQGSVETGSRGTPRYPPQPLTNEKIIAMLVCRKVRLSDFELRQFNEGGVLAFSALQALSCGLLHDIETLAALPDNARVI